ncbi:YfdQ family protein [Alicycliphilus denitrificans]|uniref:YfdQ family protein n=1 Tax=Alicycliphilus denitrificans TaxID=179636 RepID=UPI000C9F1624|nr:YfdQ family protein [Alicycliphilus denitrificans]
MDLANIQSEVIANDALAACNQATRLVGATPVVLLPEGFEAENLEKLLPSPTRKRGTTVLNDAESFIAVVNDQQDGSSTRLFSTIDPPTFTAVFNHHGSEPGWGDHRAKYNAPLSPEWKAWTGANGVKRNQVDMAQFLEANMVDVAYIAPNGPGEPGSPDGATLLEICRTLEATKKVNFKSTVRLPDGSTQFTYDEDVAGSAVKGTMAIPEQFSIGVPVFENGEKYRQDVRFRYRIQEGGNLVMWLELIRPHKVIEDAVKQLRALIGEQTGLLVLNGAPSV